MVSSLFRQSPLPLIKTPGLSAFLKMALSSLMMQHFNSSEKRKGGKKVIKRL